VLKCIVKIVINILNSVIKGDSMEKVFINKTIKHSIIYVCMVISTSLVITLLCSCNQKNGQEKQNQISNNPPKEQMESVLPRDRYSMVAQEYMDSRIITILNKETGDITIITNQDICYGDGCQSKNYNFQPTGISYLTLKDGRYTEKFETMISIGNQSGEKKQND
jgi:short subunit fatty acids transporter